jgi:hypothetical protein
MAKDWETLQEEHTIKAHALVSQRSPNMAPDPTPLPSTQLCRTWGLIHVEEYARTVCALAPLVETIATFQHLHPLAKVDLPPFVDDFHLEIDLVLDHLFLL